MRIYSKYIIGKIAWPTVLVCITLTGIAWLTQSMRFIDLIVNKGLDITTFLYLSSLILPSLLWIIVPISLFIGVLVGYNRMMKESELVVMQSSGISHFMLIKPVLLFATFVTLFSYFISFYLLPSSYHEFKEMQRFIRDNYASLLLQEGVFSTPTKGLTVYIRERDNNGTLRGIIVHDERNPSKKTTMMAKEATLVQRDGEPQFLLTNGTSQEIDIARNSLSILEFERYSMALNIFDTTINQQRWSEPEERYLHDLFFPEDTNATRPKLLNKLYAEGHYRLTWPLYNILFALIALYAFVNVEFNRRGQVKRLVASVTIAISLVVVSILLKNLIVQNIKFAALLYGWIFCGICTILYILLVNFKNKYSF